MNYVLAPEAEAELAAAALFCAQKFGRLVAENFLEPFESKVRLIAAFPDLGTSSTRGRRLFPIGRYPFSMLYRVDGGVIRISAIAHHSRRPGYWRGRE